MKIIAQIALEKMPEDLKKRPLILWDGDCGFCRRSVEWILKNDKSKTLVAAPFQKHLEWLPQEVIDKSEIQAHFVSPEGIVWGGADAVVKVLEAAQFKSAAAILSLPIMSSLSQVGYRTVAKNRLFFSRFFFKK